MDSIKESKAAIVDTENQIVLLIQILEKKIGHKVVQGTVKLNNDLKTHAVNLNVDLFDSIEPPSKIIKPQLKIQGNA